MPHVVNGCGTWYYGKKNLDRYQGVCRACGRHTTLTSYDTRLYVVFLFVPVIPLRARRIVEQCAACTRHAAVSLDDWRRAQRRTEQAVAAYHASPDDADLAKEALASVVANRDLQTFLALAPAVEENLHDDAETLRLLAGIHALFGRIAETERVLRSALEVDEDDEETREALADCLMRLDRHREAEPYLQHIVEKGIPDRAGALYQLAQAYQIEGDHEKALAVFSQCETVNPLLAQEPTFVRLREASAKALGTRVPVKPAELVRKAKSAASFRKFLKVAPAVLLVAFLAYLGLAVIQGKRRQVFLVNGIDRPYTVRLNGAPHPLAPNSVTPVRLPEGDVRVEIADLPGVTLPPETASIRTPLLTRPFDGQTFVLNPDRAVVLERAHIVYAARNGLGGVSKPRYTFVAGQLLHQFDGIDYAFEEPPSQLRMDSKTDQVGKDVLSLLKPPPNVPRPIMLTMLSSELGKQAVAEVARRRLLADPIQVDYLTALVTALPPAAVADFLRPGLDRRPLQIQWHRAYQTAMEAAGRVDEASREYDARLAKEPQNKDLMYLAGRASNDLDKSVALCQKAVEGDAPSGYAAFSLCSYYLSNGDFPQAAAHARTASRLLARQDDVRQFVKTALIAAGQFDEALALIKAEEAGPFPACLLGYNDEVHVRCLQNHPALAEQAITAAEAKLKTLTGPDDTEPLRRLRGDADYALGRMAEFKRRFLESGSTAEHHFAAHLTSGDVAAADQDLRQLGEASSYAHLTLYVAASRQGRKDLADAHLKTAIDLLAKEDSDGRAYAAALKGTPDRPTAELIRLRGRPEEKRVLLAAVGLHDPAAREACFTLGQKLNFDRRFPHLLLKDIFDAPTSPATPAK